MKYKPSIASNIPDIPLLLEIEPTSSCNLQCIMCHIPTQKITKPVFLDLDLLKKNTVGITNCNVMIGSEYEPTIHPHFEKLLKLIIERNWKIDFLSNAVRLHLFDQSLFYEVPFHVYNASFDGSSEESFSRVRVGADFHRVKENIIRLATIAKKNGAATAINATMLRSNLHETKELVRMWDYEGIDLVRLIVMQARDTKPSVLKESLYPLRSNLISLFNDIADMVMKKQLKIGVRSGFYGSMHFSPPPNIHVRHATIFSDNQKYRHVPGVRQDFQSGYWPGMKVLCKSPFVYCRIRWDGTVDLCNRREHVIGNIYNNTLYEIWRGDRANTVRKMILSDASICEACDYFRFCIGSRHQDYTKAESYFAHGVLDKPEVIDFIKTHS